jgi:hypothetical protein
MMNGLQENLLIVDLFGPIIDISRIPSFKGIDSVRYLKEDEIAKHLGKNDGGEPWTGEEVLNKTEEYVKNKKIGPKLVDREILKQICGAKELCKIRIVSSTRDTLFVHAKELLINYSKNLLNYFYPGDIKHHLDEGDFEYFNSQDKKYNMMVGVKKSEHRIVFDDQYPECDKAGSVNAWISGIDTDKPADKLKDIIAEREYIRHSDEAISKISDKGSICLSDYVVFGEFLVFEREKRERIKLDVENIKQMVKTTANDKDPVCVFLAGLPGTGKSFFVKNFTKNIEGYKIPPTSLSGVPSNDFCDAVKLHIDEVYKDYDTKSTLIAFLDEIDTKGDNYAFRLLMDAMTGDRANNQGVVDRKIEKKLVWFFAGSQGVTRKEFIESFRGDERKVVDFFDRIHFDIALPSVSDPGQSILTLLATIKKLKGEENAPKKISLKVLKLFSSSQWKSARQIVTTCRIAMSRLSGDVITSNIFGNIHVSDEFDRVYKALEEEKEDIIIDIKWK